MSIWTEAFPGGWWRRPLTDGTCLYVAQETPTSLWRWRHASWNPQRRDYDNLAIETGLATARHAREAADVYLSQARS